jgi:hypothetical protein
MFFAAYACQYSYASHQVYKLKNTELPIEGSGIRVINWAKPLVFLNVYNYIKPRISKDTTLVEFPDGVGLNYLLKREGLRYLDYNPNLIENVGEAAIIKELEQNKIEYIVVFSGLLKTSYGRPKFGIDYGSQIYSWVKQNYTLEKHFGSEMFVSNAMIGAEVYRRKS